MTPDPLIPRLPRGVVPGKPILLAGMVSLSLIAACSCARSAGDTRVSHLALPYGAQATDDRVVTNFDGPFLFTYLSWENKVTVANGRAILGGEGVTPKGGGGANVEMDLSKSANLCPVVRVKIGPRNTLKMLRFQLSDDTVGEKQDSRKRSATFDFPLPDKSTGDFVLIYPKNGATLSKPNVAGTLGTIDPAKVRQWQLQGDWGGDGAVDIEVDSVLMAEPDAAAKAGQVEAIKQEEERKARTLRENAALREKYGKRSADSPQVVEIYRVAPDILAVGIQAGKVLPGKYEPYVKSESDTMRKDGGENILIRGGQEIGWLVGKKQDGLVHFEKFVGDPLLDDTTEDPATYAVVGADGATIKPTAVWRKSKPTDQVQPGATLAMRHVVYLKLPAPLAAGKKYTVQFSDAMNVRDAQTAFTLSDTTTRSEAVHVPQIGFRPDDPAKTGSLSIWLGTGGGYEYAKPPAFRVVDSKTGIAMLTGTATLAKGKDATEKLWL
ncbi:MAG: hypothetical protein H7145_22030, partial [Akkermansiaceae bacterium]|nr:hypothetical protein [Armatimonadota bacterium]